MLYFSDSYFNYSEIWRTHKMSLSSVYNFSHKVTMRSSSSLRQNKAGTAFTTVATAITINTFIRERSGHDESSPLNLMVV